MSGDPHAHWPDRTPLTDDAGHTVLVYTPAEGTRNGRPWADGVWRPPAVSVPDAVSTSIARLPGYAVSTSDRELVDGWRAAGATELRHAHTMSHDLATIPDAASRDPSVRLHALGADQVARHAERLGEIHHAAYGPAHPDREHETAADAVREMHQLSRGEVLGPVLQVSQVAVADHAIVGAALIVDRPGQAPEGGPWVVDIFRDPTSPLRGLGRALLTAVLEAARADGLPSISLAVSHDNTNAFALYGALGFVDHDENWTLGLP